MSPLLSADVAEEHRPVFVVSPEEAEAVASWLASAWAAMPADQREDLTRRMQRLVDRSGRTPRR